MATSKPSAMSLFNNIKTDYATENKETLKEKQELEADIKADRKEEATNSKAEQESSNKSPENESIIDTANSAVEISSKKEDVKESIKDSENAVTRKVRGKGKSTPATYYMSQEILEMIAIASRAYGNNSSLYLRSLVKRDFMENGEKYKALPDIMA